MRRPWILLFALGLAAAAWWIASNATNHDDGTGAAGGAGVVHVYILDIEGKPVVPAQIVQVYDQRRASVDEAGYVRLEDVTLRAEEEPSAEAFVHALKPLARHHALRRGYEPAVTQREDGSWEVRYALHGHGILRVHVEAVMLGECKAVLEPDLPLQRWEPVGSHQVVRPGSVVDFRIYQGWKSDRGEEKVAIRLEGEADKDGAIAVATQRLLLDPPSPGHTAQVRLIPEPSNPIAGVVRMKQGPIPPSFAGEVYIDHILEDDTRVPLGTVALQDDGSFIFPDAGSGAYALHLAPHLLAGATTHKAHGGEYAEVELGSHAAWLEVDHGADHPVVDSWWFQPTGLARAVVLQRGETTTILSHHPRRTWSAVDGRPLQGGYGRIRARDPLFLVAQPASRTLRAVIQPKDGGHARVGTAALGNIGAGATKAKLTWTTPPSGSVVVRFDPKNWGEASGADVTVAGRTRSIARGRKTELEFPSVPLQGDVRVAAKTPVVLEVRWLDRTSATFRRELELDTSKPTVIDAVRQDGGTLAIVDPSGYSRTEELFVFAQSSGMPGTSSLPIRLGRSGPAPRWVADGLLPPGTYEAGWGWDTAPESWRGAMNFGGFRATFTITAGKTTTLKASALK